MKLPPWVIGVIVVAVVGGAAAAVMVVNEERAREAEIEQLAGAAEGVLKADELDSGAAQTALREIRANPASTTDRRLILAQARLLLALGRLQPAWDALAPLALALEPGPDEMLVAARILKRLHGIRGDNQQIGQAADFAEGHFEARGDVESAFLAWQCSRRAGRREAADALGEKLVSQFGETPQGKLVAALSSESTTVQQLLDLEIEFGRQRRALDGSLPPEEIDYAIAYRLLESGDKAKLDEAIRRLEGVLRTLATDTDTRHALAFALHQAGEQKKRDLHLDWLLANAPPDDPRRPTWSAMRQQPAAGR